MPAGAVGKLRKGLPMKGKQEQVGPANLLGRTTRTGTGSANLIGASGGRRREAGGRQNSGA